MHHHDNKALERVKDGKKNLKQGWAAVSDGQDRRHPSESQQWKYNAGAPQRRPTGQEQNYSEWGFTLPLAYKKTKRAKLKDKPLFQSDFDWYFKISYKTNSYLSSYYSLLGCLMSVLKTRVWYCTKSINMWIHRSIQCSIWARVALFVDYTLNNINILKTWFNHSSKHMWTGATGKNNPKEAIKKEQWMMKKRKTNERVKNGGM